MRSTRTPPPSSRRPRRPPRRRRAAGKVISAESGKLTVKVGGEDTTFTVPETAKVTIDGKEGKVDDIKPDSDVTVTSKGDDGDQASRPRVRPRRRRPRRPPRRPRRRAR